MVGLVYVRNAGIVFFVTMTSYEKEPILLVWGNIRKTCVFPFYMKKEHYMVFLSSYGPTMLDFFVFVFSSF